MTFWKSRSALARRVLTTASLLGMTVAVTACNGSSGNVLGGIASNNGYIRVINGSPDVGAVDVLIDGNIKGQGLAYGGVGGFNPFAPGTHTVNVYPAGTDTGTPLATGTISTNSSFDYTVLVTGEQHPSYQAQPDLAIQSFTEQPYSTPSGGAAVDYHYASPYAAAATGLNAQSIQFGYSLDNAPANNALGMPIGYGIATTPQGIPASATGTPITLYGIDHATGITTTPSHINATGCATDSLPCASAPNLSLYLVDGPAASTQPSGTLPDGISASAKAGFIGLTDANGLLTQ